MPAAKVVLDWELALQHVLNVQLKLIVTAFRGLRRERVKCSPLVKVNNCDITVTPVAERRNLAQQLRAETTFDKH